MGGGTNTTFVQAIQNASSGATITLDEDVSLTSTVKISKNLTIDMNGHNITATNCRAFHIVAGDVTFKNSQTETNSFGSVVGVNGKISSVKTEGDVTFKDNSSVIRVGDNDVDAGTNVKLTIEQYVKVYTKVCYGVTVFGSKTKETLVVNGEVKYDGDAGVPAISGNGSEGYEGTQITIDKTGNVIARNENAIYHPQDGTLNVYGSVGVNYGGGIEAKAGTINIYDGAKIFGNKNNVSHEKNSNGCSTKGYAIAVVNNANYGKNQGAKVIIDNPTGSISRNIAIVDDDDDTSNNHGSIVINQGYFEYCDPTPFVPDGKYVAKGQYGSTPAYWVLDSKDKVVASVKNGENVWEFGNFAKAVSGWAKGTTLTLNQDVEYATSKTWASGYDMTLDLNGHKWTYTGTTAYAFQVSNGAKFTINDSSIGKTGSIESKNQNATLIVLVGSKNAKEGQIATLVVNNGKIIGKEQAISGNGTYHNTDITINGGELEAKVPVYHPQVGKLTINGGKFTGSVVGVELRSGELNITGGEFSSTATSASVNSNGSGTTTCGYALAIAQHTTKKNIKANISGGTFTGYCGIGMLNPQNNDTENVNVTISGGKVTATGENGYALVMGHQKGSLNVTGGEFTGAINCDNDATNLLGGTYSAKPDDNLILEGFFVSQKDQVYEVVKKVEMAVDDKAEFKDENGQTLTESAKNEAQKAVSEVVNNDAVSKVEANTEEAVSKDTQVDGMTLDQKIDAAINNVEGVTKEDVTAVKTSIDINLTSASVKTTGNDGDAKTVVTQMVFDVKPVAVAFAGEKEVASVVVPNGMITQKIKFRLPVDKNATNKYVEITHKANKESEKVDNLGLFEVKSEGNNKYVELERDNFSLYTMTLSEATSTMKVYEGTSESKDIAMDKTAWNAVLTNCPNAIAIVSSENKSFAEDSEVKNVLIEYNIEDLKVYQCPKFVLTDWKDADTPMNFYTPVDFTATTGSYTRTSNNIETGKDWNYNSVCLPFALSSQVLGSNTADILTFSFYNEKDEVRFEKQQQLQAGIPCIIREKKNATWNVTFDKTKIVANPVSTNMVGTFALTEQYGKNNKSKTDFYSVGADNMFHPLESKLYPFRACLKLSYDETIGKTDDLNSSKGIKISIIGEDDEATGIKTVNSNAAETDVYTLNGVKVGSSINNLPKGIYIHNGKKVVVK